MTHKHSAATGDRSRGRSPALASVAGPVVLGVACGLVYVVMTKGFALLVTEPAETRAVGAIWAMVATIFVYRETSQARLAQSISRVFATTLSFALCELYLLFFGFSVWGLAAVIAIGGIAASVLRRPGDAGLTAITTSVVLVVAGLAPADQAWQQPLLRLVDTLVGVAVGVIAGMLWSATTTR